jgi:hypothetical protein
MWVGAECETGNEEKYECMQVKEVEREGGRMRHVVLSSEPVLTPTAGISKTSQLKLGGANPRT